MIAQLIVLLAILACTMGAVVRVPMRKHSNTDFVKGILAKANQKVGSKHLANFNGTGPVVIEDYQNSQYYGKSHTIELDRTTKSLTDIIRN
jgi:hypothetical protein